MIINKIKNLRTILLNYIILRRLDLFLRVLISKLVIPPYKIINDNNIIILYGGMGDCVGWLQCMKSTLNNNVIAIPCKHKKIISELDLKIKVIYYKNFFNLIVKLRSKYKNFNFIHTSPIFELYIVRILSGLKYGGGYIKDYSTLFTKKGYINVGDHVISNFYKRKYILLKELDIILEYPIIYNYTQKLAITYKSKIEILLNIEKSQYWKNKKVPIDEILKIIDILQNSFVNAVINLVGLDDSIGNFIGLKNPNCNNLIGKLSEKELVFAIKNSDLIVTLESGIAHLAGYFGVPLIVIETYTDANAFKPFSASCIRNNVNCSPCVKLDIFPSDIYPPLCNKDYICQDNISYNLINFLNRQ